MGSLFARPLGFFDPLIPRQTFFLRAMPFGGTSQTPSSPDDSYGNESNPDSSLDSSLASWISLAATTDNEESSKRKREKPQASELDEPDAAAGGGNNDDNDNYAAKIARCQSALPAMFRAADDGSGLAYMAPLLESESDSKSESKKKIWTQSQKQSWIQSQNQSRSQNQSQSQSQSRSL